MVTGYLANEPSWCAKFNMAWGCVVQNPDEPAKTSREIIISEALDKVNIRRITLNIFHWSPSFTDEYTRAHIPNMS